MRGASSGSALLWNHTGQGAGEKGWQIEEGVLCAPRALGSSVPMPVLSRGVKTGEKEEDINPSLSLLQPVGSSPYPLFKSSTCGKQRSLQFIQACLTP